jgi:hypothetical protein
MVRRYSSEYNSSDGEIGEVPRTIFRIQSLSMSAILNPATLLGAARADVTNSDYPAVRIKDLFLGDRASIGVCLGNNSSNKSP